MVRLMVSALVFGAAIAMVGSTTIQQGVYRDMNYKLLATDIDGTITDEKGRIHLKAVETIRGLEERGIPVALVSGRPLPFVESLALFMGTSGPVIAENGAVAKLGGKIFKMGDPQAAQEAMALLKTKFPLELDDDNRYRMVDVSIQLGMDPEKIRQVIWEAQLPVNLLVTNVMFHLVDNRVSKGRTLLKVLGDIGVNPEETVVCGDSYNDLPLFETGAFRVAVGNAEPTLKAKADRVARLPYGEGFAEAVREIFL
ncbi:MAG: phosphoglycolate phosphatase [Firmicutes bacterium]|nr:phosphoglycolate phosphatase [Bacillota bacterium]